jgi:hypothetical protein
VMGAASPLSPGEKPPYFSLSLRERVGVRAGAVSSGVDRARGEQPSPCPLPEGEGSGIASRRRSP